MSLSYILQSCTSYKDKFVHKLFEKFTLSQFETKFRIAAGYCINNVSLKIIDRLPHITQANLDEKGGNIKGEQPNGFAPLVQYFTAPHC